MHIFLSTTIQHTKYVLMILQTGMRNYLLPETSLELSPSQHLTLPAPPVIKQQHLTCISLPSTPSTAVSHSPVLPQKKSPIPTSPQRQHLPDFCQVIRKGTCPVRSLLDLDLLRTFPSKGH